MADDSAVLGQLAEEFSAASARDRCRTSRITRTATRAWLNASAA